MQLYFNCCSCHCSIQIRNYDLSLIPLDSFVPMEKNLTVDSPSQFKPKHRLNLLSNRKRPALKFKLAQYLSNQIQRSILELVSHIVSICHFHRPRIMPHSSKTIIPIFESSLCGGTDGFQSFFSSSSVCRLFKSCVSISRKLPLGCFVNTLFHCCSFYANLLLDYIDSGTMSQILLSFRLRR